MFSVVGEALTIALASIPAIWSLYANSSNTSLSVALALCVFLSGALGILFFHHDSSIKQRRQQQQHVDHPQSPGGASCTSKRTNHAQHADATAVNSRYSADQGGEAIDGGSSIGGDRTGALNSKSRRDSENNPVGTTIRRAASAPPEAATATASLSEAAVAPAMGDQNSHSNNGHRHLLGSSSSSTHDRADAKRAPGAASSSSSKPAATTAAGAAAAGAAAAGAAAAPPPSSTSDQKEPTPPSKRQRTYKRGGEVLFIAEGIAQAAVGLVRDPVRGAQADGAKGLVRGLGSGVFGVVAKPVRGVARAGANAYTGVRIGVTRAGRMVGAGGSSSSGNGGGSGRSWNAFSSAKVCTGNVPCVRVSVDGYTVPAAAVV